MLHIKQNTLINLTPENSLEKDTFYHGGNEICSEFLAFLQITEKIKILRITYRDDEKSCIAASCCMTYKTQEDSDWINLTPQTACRRIHYTMESFITGLLRSVGRVVIGNISTPCMIMLFLDHGQCPPFLFPNDSNGSRTTGNQSFLFRL